MVIIGITGSVGTGKTTISNNLGIRLNCYVNHLNDVAKKYKIKDVENLQTFDFDLDLLLKDVELEIRESKKQEIDMIFESHFAHFIDPSLVDIMFVIGRDLSKLKEEYERRGYNEKKITDNLEAESFNLCFYEAIENGYKEEKQVFLVENKDDINLTVLEILKKLNSVISS